MAILEAGSGGGRLSVSLTTTLYVEETLVLEGPRGRRNVPFRWGTADESSTARADANYRIEFAPDGHALAVARDPGNDWQYVPLDAGEHVITCEHITFQMPWDQAPATTDWLLKVLAAHRESAPTHFELGHAMLGCAVARPDDSEFQVAVTRAYATGALLLPRSDPDGVAHLRQMTRRHSAVRRLLLDSIAVPRAAEIMERMRDPEAQEALAEAMSRAVRVRSPSEISRLNDDQDADLARSLAVMTRDLGTASERVRATLMETALLPRGEGVLVQLYCLQALEGVDRSRAGEAAARMEGVPCAHGAAPWSWEPDELWGRVRNQGWDSENQRYFTLCCWATAARSEN